MTGTVRFDENGVRNMNNNPDDRRYLILQVKKGQFVHILSRFDYVSFGIIFTLQKI